MYATLTEIIDRSEQGATRPFICKCDDGNIYYVKGHDAGRKTLIAEWLCGRIGREMGLNIPEFKIVEIPRPMIEFGARDDLEDLGTQPAFGSKQVEGTLEIPYSTVHKLAEPGKASLLLFDWWVMNADRTLSEYGGNPNLLYSSKENEIWVIDHNLAFDTEGADSILENHIFAEALTEWDETFRKDAIEKMTGIMTRIDHFWNEMPEEWTEFAYGIDLAKITGILARFRDKPEDFWRQG
jgi:hypothetical protein